jgi:predicted metal-dependent hydrolase
MTITDDTTRTTGPDGVGTEFTAAKDAARRQEAREATGRRVAKLNTASVRRVIEPDTDVVGSVGEGAVYGRQLSTVADLDLDLSEEQWATHSREELASVVVAGIRFESLLMSGFAMQLAHAPSMSDPRVTYMLHEIGEETRHSRLFVRLVTQLAPKAVSPLDKGLPGWFFRQVTRFVVRRPATLFTLVLAGEEIPDLLQKKLVEHPETDPFVKEVNRYHRLEEARHLAYARLSLPELWAEASWFDRFSVKYLVPVIVQIMFDGMVHPGVYETVGLPGMATWRAANHSAHQVSTRHEATRPVLATLLGAGVLQAGRIPALWRRVTGVDRQGQPVGD